MLKKTQSPISKWRAVMLRDPAIGPGLAGGYDLPPKDSARENWSSLVI
jgi:hypothetical protein